MIIKNLAKSNNPIIEEINKLSQSVNNETYWIHKPQPILTKMFNLINSKRWSFQRNPTLPCFMSNWRCLIPFAINVADLKITKSNDIHPHLIDSILDQNINSLRPNFVRVFTDASLMLNPTRVGFGVFIPAFELKLSARLLDTFSIYSAELVAIWYALLFIDRKNIRKALILSDSQSAIMRISFYTSFKNGDYLVIKIRECIFQLKSKGFNICLAWIPSHQGIKGNETVDGLAKRGCECLNFYNCLPPFSDLFSLFKKVVWGKWESLWKVKTTNKARWYCQIETSPRNRTWFHKLPNIDRKCIVLINRLRSGLTMAPSFLFKKNISDSPNCDCGAEGNLDHLFLECPLYNIQRKILLNCLNQLKIFPPHNVLSLLAISNLKVYRILCSYIFSANILL